MTPGPLAYTRTKCPDPATAYGGPGGEVVLDQAPDGKISLDVRLEKESLWLTQNQVSLLFDTERSVVTKHLKNIFNSGELDKDSVCAFFAHTAEDGKTYKTQYYNLDAILSVGYRVNSGRGTQFRIWATQVLRDHVLKGYTVNLRRLEELKQTLKLASIVADQRALNGGEAAAILHVLRDYAFALSVLDDYDHGRVPRPEAKRQEAEPISPGEARRLVAVLRERFGGSDLFGREKDGSLAGSLAAIFQTAGGKQVYPSTEEKAAHLLYFLVKNHPFTDGNKRIGAALFLRFLEKRVPSISRAGRGVFPTRRWWRSPC